MIRDDLVPSPSFLDGSRPHDADELVRCAGDVGPDELPPDPEAVAAPTRREAAPATYASLADLCRALAVRPTPQRLPIGLATLDEACRGGIPAGSRVVIVGAPGAGKTTLAAQLAHDWAIGGARVLYLVADTVTDPILTRLGQRDGLCRDDLDGVTGDEPRRAAWLTLADRLAALPMLVLDGADVALEDAIAALRNIPGEGPLVLVVDSLQTVRCKAAAGAENPRARMDLVLAVLRAAVGIIVVALSEMNRGGYVAGAQSPTSTLAASKESGAIEYIADVLIGLRSVAGESDLVDLDTAKNRHGVKVDLRLRLDFNRAQFCETDRPDAPTKTDREAERTTRDERAARDAVSDVVRALAAAGVRGASSRDMRAALVGRRGVLVDAAVKLAVADGMAIVREYRGHDRFYAPSAAPAEQPNAGEPPPGTCSVCKRTQGRNRKDTDAGRCVPCGLCGNCRMGSLGTPGVCCC